MAVDITRPIELPAEAVVLVAAEQEEDPLVITFLSTTKSLREAVLEVVENSVAVEPRPRTL